MATREELMLAGALFTIKRIDDAVSTFLHDFAGDAVEFCEKHSPGREEAGGGSKVQSQPQEQS